MRKLLALLPLLFLIGVADARLPKGCACNGLVNAGTPISGLATGTYATAQSETLTNPASPTPSAQICYTTDLSNPTCPVTGTSQVYTGAIAVSSTTTFKYTAGNVAGFNQSPIGTVKITIETQLRQPTFAPATGSYSDVGFTFTMSCPAGSSGYYTTDGSTPTYPATGSTQLYTAAVSLPTAGNWNPQGLCQEAGFITSATNGILYTLTGSGPAGACDTGVTVGTLNLTGKVTRVAGASPLQVFFDMSGTTDSGIASTSTPFLDVTYLFNFGDTNASGTSTWNYGSNPGKNSRNYAIGGIATHMYITNGVDTTPQVTVTAHSTSGNTASCTFNLTVYDNSDAPPNGFSGTNTVCVSSSGTPVAGSGGCPVGAAVRNSATFSGVMPAAMSGLRYLFKCGDTFAYGSGVTIHGNTFRVGSYGSPACTGTQTNLPIIQRPQSGDLLTIGSGPVQSTDGVIADLDCEGTGTFNTSSSGGCFFNGQDSPADVYPEQITYYNLLSNHNAITMQSYFGSQISLVQVVMNEMGYVGGDQGVFLNNQGNRCVNGASALYCGTSGWVASNYVNDSYNAIVGSHLDGNAALGSGSGPETVRISACRMCTINNSDMLNATQTTAVLKLHDDNSGSAANGPWYGQYMELAVVSDNYFANPLTSPPSGQLVEITPENAVTDERNQNLLIERNIFVSGNSGQKGLALSVCQNARVSDNVFTAGVGLAIQKRGIECTHTSGAPVNSLSPELVEAYNNTCYNSSTCELSTAWTPAGSVGNNNDFINTLAYNASGGTVISAGGTGNTISNNTGTITANPGFTNPSTHFDVISDFQPTANYSGALNNVPVLYDAVGTPWAPTWNLGAVSFAAPPSAYKIFYGDAAVSGSANNLTPFTQVQSDVAALKAFPTKGVHGLYANSDQMYVVGYTWSYLENGAVGANPVSDATNGTGEFAGFTTIILAAYTELQRQLPGANFGMYIQSGTTGAKYDAVAITGFDWATQGGIHPANGVISLGGCPSNCGTLAVTTGLGGPSVNYPIAPICIGCIYYGIAFDQPATDTVSAGSISSGHIYKIATVGTTNFVAIGASSNTVGVQFTATGTGSGTGTATIQYLTFGDQTWWNPGVNRWYMNFYQALSLWQYCPPVGHTLYNASCASTGVGKITLDTDPQFLYLASNDEYSYAFDTSTNVPGVTVNPLPIASGQPDPTNTYAYSQYNLLWSTVTGYFPHTMIGVNFTFGFDGGHGADSNANMAAYVNQYIGNSTSLSTSPGLAYSSSDTLAEQFSTTVSQASSALAGFVGCPAGSSYNMPFCPGGQTAQSLDGAMPDVAQVQPTDYGVAYSQFCPTKNTSCVVSNIAAQANTHFIHVTSRLWWMADGATGGNTAWTTYISQTINGTPATIGGVTNLGVAPVSTTRPTNLH